MDGSASDIGQFSSLSEIKKKKARGVTAGVIYNLGKVRTMMMLRVSEYLEIRHDPTVRKWKAVAHFILSTLTHQDMVDVTHIHRKGA